jgi:hypothetical protein
MRFGFGAMGSVHGLQFGVLGVQNTGMLKP